MCIRDRICSVYRNDQIQELGRSGKQAVIWYLEDDIQEGVLGLAQSVDVYKRQAGWYPHFAGTEGYRLSGEFSV